MKILFILIILFMAYSCDNMPKPNQTIEEDLFNERWNITIEVVQLAPHDEESFKNREFRLLTTDSLIWSIVDNQNNGDKYYKKLFLEYWSTEKDWFVNVLLHVKYEVNAIIMMSFAPNLVDEWRSKEKNNDYNYWVSFFSNVSD